MINNKTFWTKSDWTLTLPFLVFVASFTFHYYLVINFIENLYQYSTQEVRDKMINDEKLIFNINLIGNSLLFLFIIIGTILTLNIGFIFFGYEFKFKEVCTVVIKSSIIIAMVYFILPILMYFETEIYTFESLYKIEVKYTLAKNLPDFSPIWLSNLLESFSICQIVYVALLIVGIKNVMKWNYKKSILNIIKIYGIGFLIWHSFALIMDVNFHQ
jgi:hypothetical protein